MAIYGQPTVSAVFVGETGHHHTKAGGPNDYFVIDCDPCEPFLKRMGGWGPSPADVPLTESQQVEKERVEREGAYAMKQATEALAAAAARVVGDDGPRGRRKTA